MDLPWHPAARLAHTPQTSTTPPSPPGESKFDSPLFDAPHASQNFGAGEVGVGG